jgi:hypothetical protein
MNYIDGSNYQHALEEIGLDAEAGEFVDFFKDLSRDDFPIHMNMNQTDLAYVPPDGENGFQNTWPAWFGPTAAIVPGHTQSPPPLVDAHSTAAVPPPEHIAMLTSDPSTASQFDEIYGLGKAKAVLAAAAAAQDIERRAAAATTNRKQATEQGLGGDGGALPYHVREPPTASNPGKQKVPGLSVSILEAGVQREDEEQENRLVDPPHTPPTPARTNPAAAVPPPEHIAMLKSDPSTASQFDEIYGLGKAEAVLADALAAGAGGAAVAAQDTESIMSEDGSPFDHMFPLIRSPCSTVPQYDNEHGKGACEKAKFYIAALILDPSAALFARKARFDEVYGRGAADAVLSAYVENADPVHVAPAAAALLREQRAAKTAHSLLPSILNVSAAPHAALPPMPVPTMVGTERAKALHVPMDHVDLLLEDPSRSVQFDDHYGAGSTKTVLSLTPTLERALYKLSQVHPRPSATWAPLLKTLTSSPAFAMNHFLGGEPLYIRGPVADMDTANVDGNLFSRRVNMARITIDDVVRVLGAGLVSYNNFANTFTLPDCAKPATPRNVYNFDTDNNDRNNILDANSWTGEGGVLMSNKLDGWYDGSFKGCDLNKIMGKLFEEHRGMDGYSTISPGEVLRLLVHGPGTLVLNRASSLFPAAAAIARDVSEHFRIPINVNVYVTAQNATIVTPPHNDAQDVLMLQFAGRKRWRLYAPRNHSVGKYAFKIVGKISGNPPQKDPIAVEELRGGPVMDVVLSPGDALWVPRGYVHATLPADQSSDDFSVHSKCGTTCTMDY